MINRSAAERTGDLGMFKNFPFIFILFQRREDTERESRSYLVIIRFHISILDARFTIGSHFGVIYVGMYVNAVTCPSSK